ncbi:hypothetical protein D3C75_703630 [compost metagenome]
MRHLLAQVLGFGGIGLLQQLADLGVGQARMGVDHRLVELVAGQLAALRHGHLADHGQAIDQRIQRAQAVGQLLGQHRDHPLGEIHRVAALDRLLVQRRTDLHVVRYVGDGDEQPPAGALDRLGIHRVIEVAGILAIDGDEGQLAQIDALVLVLLLHLGLELLRLGEQRLRPLVGQVVAAHGDLDLHAGRHVVAEHLDHFTLGLTEHRRPHIDAHLDELAVVRRTLLARQDQHLLLDLRIVGHHHGNAALLEEAANQGFVGALEHLDQRAFAPATPVETGNPRQRTVAVEHQAHLRRTEEQVVAAVVGNQEAETVAMAADAPADQVQLVHRGIGAATGIDQLAIALHGTQPATQGLLGLLACQTQLFEQLGTGSRRTALGQVRQDQLATGDGVCVFFRFAGGLGIEGLPIIGHMSGFTCGCLARGHAYIEARKGCFAQPRRHNKIFSYQGFTSPRSPRIVCAHSSSDRCNDRADEQSSHY